MAVSAKSSNDGNATGEGENNPAGNQQLGRYTVLKPVGAGAMGVVYAAYDPELDRRVALKLIKAGLYDDAVAQRFLSERQSLAMMEHPAIAKVFEAGATAVIQPGGSIRDAEIIKAANAAGIAMVFTGTRHFRH